MRVFRALLLSGRTRVGPLLVLAIGSPLYAHDLSRSTSSIEVDGRDVRVRLMFDLAGLSGIDANRDGRVSYDELDAGIEQVFRSVKQHFLLRAKAEPLRIAVTSYSLSDDHVLHMEMVETFAESVMRLDLTSTLHELARPDHVHVTSVTIDGAVHEAVLGLGTPTASFAAGGHATLETISKFVGLGIEHVFTAFDYLAFLVGLVVVTTSIRSLVKVVASFAIAHSVTLALATFNVVVLPARQTEMLIALGIAYVALENLFAPRLVERTRVAFLFGLVHGFGLSNALWEMTLARPSPTLSLLSFGAGVEIGQAVFVLAMLGLVGMLALPRWPQLRPAISVAVVCLGAYWFVERAFL